MEHPFNEDLQAALDADGAYEFLPHGTWMEGGCSLLAQALERVVPDSELVCVGRQVDELGVVDHVVLAVDLNGERFYLDYDGLQGRDELIDKVQAEWNIHPVHFAAFEAHALNEAGVLAQEEAVTGFARYLLDQLGPVNEDRLSLCWVEDEVPGPGL